VVPAVVPLRTARLRVRRIDEFELFSLFVFCADRCRYSDFARTPLRFDEREQIGVDLVLMRAAQVVGVPL
jgi:hypothetical protein